ncbi:MAG: hypothetical protein CEO12_93 [Parcubacteria group bacterium Gr01-1014_46]|nr:MAG: hypothetical protein CEO12_93 [Parcubacteria group bacterium Gr01-1014_46]
MVLIISVYHEKETVRAGTRGALANGVSLFMRAFPDAQKIKEDLGEETFLVRGEWFILREVPYVDSFFPEGVGELVALLDVPVFTSQ